MELLIAENAFVWLEKIGEDGSPAVLPEMTGDVDVDVDVVVEEGCVVDVLAVVLDVDVDAGVDVVFKVGCVDVGEVVFDEVEFDIELEDCVGWVVVVFTVDGDVMVVKFVEVFVVGWTVVVLTVEFIADDVEDEDEEVGWFVELAVVFVVEGWVVEVVVVVVVVVLIEEDPEVLVAVGWTVEVVLLEELEFVCTSITAGPKL